MVYQIFGRLSCNYCQMARDFLQSKNIPFVFYNLKEADVVDMYNSKFKSLVPAIHTTVPVIFYNSHFIGGYNDLITLFK